MDEQLSLAIAVCICTYRRPELVRQCLLSVAAQTVRADPRVDLRVVVVDNDSQGSAEVVRPEAAAIFGDRLRWCVEHQQGIAYARNRAVAEANTADVVVFIDDDEIADSHWLDALLATRARYDADVVAGPVLPRPESEPPPWWLRIGAGNRQIHPEGASLTWAASGNVLVSTKALARYTGPFSPQLALIGSEDTELFMRMARDGAVLVWSADAAVAEVVPSTRMTLAWLARRRLRGHSTWALLEHEILGVPRLGRFARSWVRVFEGAVRALLGLLAARRDRLYEGTLTLLGGVGGIIGSAGYAFEEYGPADRRRRWPTRVRIERPDDTRA